MLKLDNKGVVALEITDVRWSKGGGGERPHRRIAVALKEPDEHGRRVLYAHLYGEPGADFSCLLTDLDQKLMEKGCEEEEAKHRQPVVTIRDDGTLHHIVSFRCRCGAAADARV